MKPFYCPGCGSLSDWIAANCHPSHCRYAKTPFVSHEDVKLLYELVEYSGNDYFPGPDYVAWRDRVGPAGLALAKRIKDLLPPQT